MNEQSPNKSSAGKGDRPRNCFSKQYRDNYDSINWKRKIELLKNNEKKVKNYGK